MNMNFDCKSGYVTIIGRPNVGKSTFLNRVLETKISITTNKPQTTRDRILGIFSDEESQIIFLDTPGVHDSPKEFNKSLVEKAVETLDDADVILAMAEPRDTPQNFAIITDLLKRSGRPAILVLNKADTMDRGGVEEKIDDLADLYDFKDHLVISALEGGGVSDLLRVIKRELPEGPRYFPDDMLTDVTERFLCQELIREKVFELTRQEIPYSVAVQVETFTEGDPTRIQACIHVERDSQKGIVIGRGGQQLKQIGIQARQEIERLLGCRVYLELFVRVSRDWTKNPRMLKELGYE